MEVKVIKDKTYELFDFCSPNQVVREESSRFFDSKLIEGWIGIGVFEEKELKAMAQVVPLEKSLLALEGEDLYMLNCYWVKPGEEGKGYGKALMEKILEITRDRKGVVAWGAEGWMPPSFFEKYGFEFLENWDNAKLFLKKYTPDAYVKIINTGFKPLKGEGKVIVEAVYSPQCPYIVANYEEAISKALEFSPQVLVLKHIILNREQALEFGSENFYIDGESLFFGPIEINKLETILKEKVENLKTSGC
ncbi:MAG: hypothetical protein DDT40_01214 [candidate division WS2 bacterium]|nr:hypothetical protein [Candidatus Psychracetigena formicireducens]MBT9151030.1 hypothetical protein [Candidatus Psychracetigena formicireducens]